MLKDATWQGNNNKVASEVAHLYVLSLAVCLSSAVTGLFYSVLSILVGCLSLSFSVYKSLLVGRIANVFSCSALQLAFSFCSSLLMKRDFQISIRSNLQRLAFTAVLFLCSTEF